MAEGFKTLFETTPPVIQERNAMANVVKAWRTPSGVQVNVGHSRYTAVQARALAQAIITAAEAAEREEAAWPDRWPPRPGDLWKAPDGGHWYAIEGTDHRVRLHPPLASHKPREVEDAEPEDFEGWECVTSLPGPGVSR
jgi:hypothetical protein